MTTGLRKAQIPVVTAPFGFTFGGGCEITMGGDRVCAAAETYIGLVEVGVGLIPAGGGCLFMLERVLEGIDKPMLSNLPFLRTAFENIGMAKVATSGEEARDRKFLRPSDKVEINRDQQLWTAKRMAIGMAEEGYLPPLPKKLKLPGRGGPGDPQDDAAQHEAHPLDLLPRREDRHPPRAHPVRWRHHHQRPGGRADHSGSRARGLPLLVRRTRRPRTASRTCSSTTSRCGTRKGATRCEKQSSFPSPAPPSAGPRRAACKDTRPEYFASEMLKALVDRTPGLEKEMVDDIVFGCAMPEGEQGMNVARLIGFAAGFPT